MQKLTFLINLPNTDYKVGRLYFTGNFYLVFYWFWLKSDTNSNAYSKTIPKSNPNPNPNLNPNLNP